MRSRRESPLSAEPQRREGTDREEDGQRHEGHRGGSGLLLLQGEVRQLEEERKKIESELAKETMFKIKILMPMLEADMLKTTAPDQKRPNK